MAMELKVEDKIKIALEVKVLSPLKKVYEGVGEMVTRLGAFVVKKDEDYQSAMQALKDAKGLRESIKITKETLEEYKVALDFVTKVDALVKAIDYPVELGIKDLKRRMEDFQTEEADKRRKAANALELKKQQEAAKLVTADTTKEQIKIEQKMEKIEAKQEDLLAFKPKTVDMERKFEVIDPEKVERQYCSPVDAKIRPFVGKPGTPYPAIAGVKIWDKPKIVTR